MTAAALTLLMAVEAEERIDTGAPPLVWGVAAFAILLLLLLATMVFGKGRS